MAGLGVIADQSCPCAGSGVAGAGVGSSCAGPRVSVVIVRLSGQIADTRSSAIWSGQPTRLVNSAPQSSNQLPIPSQGTSARDRPVSSMTGRRGITVASANGVPNSGAIGAVCSASGGTGALAAVWLSSSLGSVGFGGAGFGTQEYPPHAGPSASGTSRSLTLAGVAWAAVGVAFAAPSGAVSDSTWALGGGEARIAAANRSNRGPVAWPAAEGSTEIG